MYFITSVSKDDSRCVGYISSLDEAKYIVENNKYDLNEAGCYPHCVIENIREGIYQYDFHPLWYEYNEETNKYIQISEKPVYITMDTVGYAIG